MRWWPVIGRRIAVFGERVFWAAHVAETAGRVIGREGEEVNGHESWGAAESAELDS